MPSDDFLQILHNNELSLKWLEQYEFAAAGAFWVMFFSIMNSKKIPFEIWSSGHTYNYVCGDASNFEIEITEMVRQLLIIMQELV